VGRDGTAQSVESGLRADGSGPGDDRPRPDDPLPDDDAAAFATVYEAMADALVAGDWSDLENGAFFTHVGEHMHDWLDCLAELGDRPLRSALPEE
jgi:hypothetical protein